MRSFHLFVAMLTLLVFSPAKSANSSVIPNQFFTVTLAYDDLTTEQSQDPKAKLNQYAQQGMQVLLMRLTGQPQFLQSKLGQNYVKQAKKWLASYYVKPRVEDGVTVGQDIALRYDAHRMKQAFQNQNVNLLTSAQRPATLVMGSFVQQGRLQKLNQELLGYRVDVDFRDYPQALRLPIMVPETNSDWIFPVDASNNLSKIQENILRYQQQNLLSFKMLAKTNGQYEINWMLFALNGDVLAQGSQSSTDRQQLLQQMFNGVMQRYAKITAVETLEKNRLTLNIHQVSFGEQLKRLETELIAQKPLITKVDMLSLQAGRVQFAIEYQGSFETMLDWLKVWQSVTLTNELEAPEVVDVNVRYQLFQPELQTPAESGTTTDQVNSSTITVQQLGEGQ